MKPKTITAAVKFLEGERDSYRAALSARLATLETAGIAYASDAYPALQSGTFADDTAAYMYAQLQASESALMEISRLAARAAFTLAETKAARRLAVIAAA